MKFKCSKCGEKRGHLIGNPKRSPRCCGQAMTLIRITKEFTKRR